MALDDLIATFQNLPTAAKIGIPAAMAGGVILIAKYKSSGATGETLSGSSVGGSGTVTGNAPTPTDPGTPITTQPIPTDPNPINPAPGPIPGPTPQPYPISTTPGPIYTNPPPDPQGVIASGIWSGISTALAGAPPGSPAAGYLPPSFANSSIPNQANPATGGTVAQYQALVLGQFAGGTGVNAIGAPINVQRGLMPNDVTDLTGYLTGLQASGGYNPNVPAIGNATNTASLIASLNDNSAIYSTGNAAQQIAARNTAVTGIQNSALAQLNAGTISSLQYSNLIASAGAAGTTAAQQAAMQGPLYAQNVATNNGTPANKPGPTVGSTVIGPTAGIPSGYYATLVKQQNAA